MYSLSHSIAPWRIKNGRTVVCDGNLTVCTAHLRGSGSDSIPKANAKLISAAPDLLKALAMVASKIQSGDDRPDDTFADFNGEETEMIFHALNRIT